MGSSSRKAVRIDTGGAERFSRDSSTDGTVDPRQGAAVPFSEQSQRLLNPVRDPLSRPTIRALLQDRLRMTDRLPPSRLPVSASTPVALLDRLSNLDLPSTIIQAEC